MKEYMIQKVKGNAVDWEQIPKVEIENYLWLNNGYEPRVYAGICYDENAIYVKFWAYEEEVRAQYCAHGGPVCRDSCVEFFFRPTSSPLFINIETNILGYMLIGIGSDRHDRRDIPVEEETMQIVASTKDIESYDGKCWTVSYQIPFSFLKKYYGEIDFVKDGLRANLYKCGDETKWTHYGAWNPVETPQPDFHRPEYFASMRFE